MSETRDERRTHVAWHNMHARCAPDNKKHRRRYFDRGIRVCARWTSYDAFRLDMGLCPRGLQLDRIDNDQGYEPGNCRWATRRVQQSNLSTNRLMTFRGRTQHVSAWARELGIPKTTIIERVRRYGWTTEQALSRTVPHKGAKP